jgi:hypothetical protein
MKLTALGRIAELSTLANNARWNAKDRGNSEMESYREGECTAYNKAHEIMKAELQRLRNLLQNGSLSQTDFGDDLPY